MTNLYEARIPGYESGPLAHLPELLDEPLFWLGHLYARARSEEAQELLFGADHDAAQDFHRQLFRRPDRPAFTVPLNAGRLHVVHRNFEDDAGTDFLLQHPDWDRAELLATVDGHFMGPALSWPELATVADYGPTGGSTTDPDHRLLLLLPAFGDADLPVEAPARLAAALKSLTAVEDPDRLAAALLADQGPCGPARWTTTRNGLRINDGGHSYRNPANGFALPADRLAHVTTSLTL
ncbi:hypothetical protein OG401_40860 [Kitasatospora purpeofusca]|uniref:hypothetical protein n=1 Tax=Kitasatospora purpeofusca TaxID=67352 RepID=UPI00225C2A96|nr:hypothetical protein [Kitasatospora purpeofusca]MCX4690575.1 hypothetical protein [Kitasatospora purpeofusca]